MSLPNWYIKGIPRVSDVVSFVSPFKGTDWERRYWGWLFSKRALLFWPNGWSIKQIQEISKFDEKIEDEWLWINKKKISLKWMVLIEASYIIKATTTGTYIHQVMEDYVNNEPLQRNLDDNDEVRETIDGGLLYIDEIKKLYTKAKGYTLVAEPVLRDVNNRFQWSSDLIVIHEGRKEIIVIDWKSFWIAKSFFNLPNKYKKPYDKIKKGRLQFSLYWETYKQKGYTVKDLVLVYLHKEWAYAYSLEQYTTEELDVILEAYKASKQTLEDNLINITINEMFELKITHPTIDFWKVELWCNFKELDNWETVSETIGKMCKVVKVTSNEMKK